MQAVGHAAHCQTQRCGQGSSGKNLLPAKAQRKSARKQQGHPGADHFCRDGQANDHISVQAKKRFVQLAGQQRDKRYAHIVPQKKNKTGGPQGLNSARAVCSLKSRHGHIVGQGALCDESQQFGKLKQQQKADEQRGPKVERQGRNARGDGVGLQGQLQAQHFLFLAKAAGPVSIEGFFDGQCSIGNMPGRCYGCPISGSQACPGQLVVGSQQLFQRLILAAQAGNINALVDKIFKIAASGFGQNVGLGADGLFDVGVKERQRAAGVEHLCRANDDKQHFCHARKAHAHGALAGEQAQAARQNQPGHKAGSGQQQG